MALRVSDADKHRAILHIVNDYTNLVSSGTLIQKVPQPPISTHVQYSFLVECRKFAGFFRNNRGPKGTDIVSKDYVNMKRVKLPVWNEWHDHMNQHLMHLSYCRLYSKTQWNGHTVNAVLLDEFRRAWKLFLAEVEEPFRSEFETHVAARASRPEYSGLDFR
jgi:hypothetical protein